MATLVRPMARGILEKRLAIGFSLLFLYVLQYALHGVDAEAMSEAKCEDLGFTGLALCSDCDSLAEYVKDEGD